MEKERREIRLGTLSQQDAIYCKDCAILILRHVRSPKRWPPLIGRKYLSCPVCGKFLVSLEENDSDLEEEEW